jgi:hypothetical protein
VKASAQGGREFWEIKRAGAVLWRKPEAEEERGARASAYLKAQMKEADVTYAELVKRLKKRGLKETEAGITMKLKRGTFSATLRRWNWEG